VSGTKVRALRPEDRDAFEAYVRYCQAEPLPADAADAAKRLREAAERWPDIAALFSDVARAAAEPELDDPELAALRTCITALLPLDADARRRVIEYVAQRFPEDA
jgi:hypothetical protein